MRRALLGGVELDDDRTRVDVAAVHKFVSEESYWARGRAFAEVARLIESAARVVGLYHGAEQIGFARIVSDGASIAYLADVYVLAGWRGRGLGTELVRECVEEGPFARTRWVLHTLDMHALYRRFGFGEPGERLMERPARPAGTDG
jgi:GNAT superfamily N-acetyltransferase